MGQIISTAEGPFTVYKRLFLDKKHVIKSKEEFDRIEKNKKKSDYSFMPKIFSKIDNQFSKLDKSKKENY